MSDRKNLLQIATEVVDPTTGKPKIFCKFCNVTFVRMGNLYVHLRKFHDLPVAVKSSQVCGLCSKKVRTINLLHDHIQNEHDIPLKFVDKTFYSKSEFLEWKTKIEKETLSSFAARNTNCEKDKGIKLSYYMCHRSGQCRSKQNRVRKMKAVGSIKTGSTCPAIMKVSTLTIDGLTEIKVQYQSVHIGHDLETRTFRLTKEERENLAACLKLGISMDKILEQAKQNSSPTNRYSFLTRKHLHNICRDYRIKLDAPKTKRVRRRKKNSAETSDCSNDCGDYLEIEVSNYEEIHQNEEIPENEKMQERESFDYGDNLEIEVNNFQGIHQNEEILENERIPESEEIQKNKRIQKMQEHEKITAVSSLLMLQNHNTVDLENRKVQIFNQITALQLRIKEWDSACPLPEVEDHIRALNALLDISAASNPNLHLDGRLPVLSEPLTNKRRKVTLAKKGSKKNSVFV